MNAADLGGVMGEAAAPGGIAELIAKVRAAVDELEAATGTGEAPMEEQAAPVEGEAAPMPEESEGMEEPGEMMEGESEEESPEALKARFAKKKGMRPKEPASMEDYFSNKGRA